MVTFRLLAVSILCSVIGAPSAAEGIAPFIDQKWDNTALGTSTFYGFNAAWGEPAQVFTPTVTGQLTQVDVYVARQGGSPLPVVPLAVSVWSVSAGVPSIELARTEIAGSIFLASDRPAWAAADFSGLGVHVDADEPLAIVLSSTGVTHYSWYNSTNASQSYFPQGQALFRLASDTNWTSQPNSESRYFRQYVVIPEPATICLHGLGIVLLSTWRRRRCRLDRAD